MRTKEEIQKRIEGVEAIIQGYKNRGKVDNELYAGLIGELEALQWVIGE